MSANQVLAQHWQQVPDIDLGKFKPSDFTDDEVDLPYYLKHFHTIANSVVEDGPDKGFINIAVWRGKNENVPANTRIMENIISLAYFYSKNRPWNVYYGSPAVRQRLEAALNFWCNAQRSDGSFPENKGNWVIAATAFATKFMGQTLVYLKSGPPIDEALRQRVIQADKKAITYILTDPKMYNDGRSFTNQFTCAYAGATSYLAIYPDKQMREQLLESMKKSEHDFQSPAGFFYEEAGIDFGYNFDTHHSNLWVCYSNTRKTDTAIADFAIRDEAGYYEWLKYNVVPEPKFGYYTVNRGIEMRQHTPVLFGHILEAPLGEAVPGMAAFNDDLNENKKKIDDARKSLERNWPHVKPLEEGNFTAYTPYTFLHREMYHWYPTSQEKRSAIASLPYYANKNFIHQKMDSRSPWILTYINKLTYYATLNAGPVGQQKLKMQRFGLGLLWNSKSGTFLQSQANTDIGAWGTRGINDSLVYEAGGIKVSFSVNGDGIHPQVGSHDLKQGSLMATYALSDKGSKTLVFDDQGVKIHVDHPGKFVEQLPILLTAGDKIKLIDDGTAKIEKSGVVINITYGKGVKAKMIKTGLKSGVQEVTTLELESSENLSYAIAIDKQ